MDLEKKCNFRSILAATLQSYLHVKYIFCTWHLERKLELFIMDAWTLLCSCASFVRIWYNWLDGTYSRCYISFFMPECLTELGISPQRFLQPQMKGTRPNISFRAGENKYPQGILCLRPTDCPRLMGFLGVHSLQSCSQSLLHFQYGENLALDLLIWRSTKNGFCATLIL